MEIIESREIIGYEQPDLYIIFRINNKGRKDVGSAHSQPEAEIICRMLVTVDLYCAYELNPKYNN